MTTLLDEKEIAFIFLEIKKILEARDKSIFVDWSRTTLEEINPCIEQSLAKKYKNCRNGYNAQKIAGMYAFWIAKLKPLFSVIANFRIINEYAGIMAGTIYIRERTGITINLFKPEILETCGTLRYHSSSPHTLAHIFGLWLEREQSRK